jgi:glycosyltransferase involved in cell wall biosynthesis
VGRPRVVTIDWFIDSYVRRRYRLPDDLIVPIPIGVDPARFENTDPQARPRVRERLGIGDKPMILSVGHVIPLRDRLLPVRALPHVLARRPDAVLVVVGKVYDDRFLRLAADLGVEDHLVVTGEVTRDEMPAYVAAADVEGHDFQNYGLGTASLEVMAAGIPVVSVVRTDNFPGIELRSWENLVIVPPDDAVALADALVRLLDEPETRARLGQAERALIRDYFSIAAVAEQHVALYEKLERG